MTEKRKSAKLKIPWVVIIPLVVVIAIGAFALFGQQIGAETPKSANETLPPRPAKGHPAPEFTLVNLEGEEVRLEDFRGQPVILNFWASWCGPCRLEMPHLQAAYEEYGSDGVVILGVNLTKRESRMDDVTAFVDEFDLTFPIVLDDDGDVATIYEVHGQPTSVFIDKNGVVNTVFYGPVNEEFISARIQELMGT